MTNQQILEKVLQKAIDGGWITFATYNVTDGLGAWATVKPEEGKEWQSKIIYWQPLESIIFNHDFAKALWGENLIISQHANNLGQVGSWHEPAWQYHLQQMVIADDPIKYLGENI